MAYLNNSTAVGAPPTHKLTDGEFETFEVNLGQELTSEARVGLQVIVDAYLLRADFKYLTKTTPILDYFNRLEKQFDKLNKLLDEGPKDGGPDAGIAAKIIYANSRTMPRQPDLDELFSIAVYGAEDCRVAKSKLEAKNTDDRRDANSKAELIYILESKKGRGPATDPEYDEFIRKLMSWAKKWGISPNADFNPIADTCRTPFVALVDSLTARLGDKIPDQAADATSTVRRLTKERRAREKSKRQN